MKQCVKELLNLGLKDEGDLDRQVIEQNRSDNIF